jgi:lipopolysaccharide export system protein LptA
MTIKVILTYAISVRYLLAFISCLPIAVAVALPEDVEQPILIDYNSSKFLLDEGKQMLYGSLDEPAVVTQGTLKISGLEIITESINGEVKKVTVTGAPAHFQHQPAIDQGLAIAVGDTIIMDFDTQHMSAIGKVTFTQDGNVWSGCQIDYFIGESVTTPACENGEQASLFIPPRNDQ